MKKAARVFKPLTLTQWLGPGTLKPPQEALHVPGFSHLKVPRATPDGDAITPVPLPPDLVERLTPPSNEPEYAAWLQEDAGGKKPRWHSGQDGAAYYHAGRDWGRALEGHWAWMREYYKLWWTLAEGGQPLVRHADHWWWQEQGVWFLLHEGEPWAWRYFADWKQEGLIHPATGTRMIYSADGARVAVVTPGAGTAVFDARTGSELADVPP